MAEEYTDDILSSFLEKSKSTQAVVDYRMKLAAKIYRGMKAKGWNNTDFANAMGKQNSVISKWLSGTHNFESDTLFEIQNKLNIRLLDVEIKNKAVPGEFKFTLDVNVISDIADAGGMQPTSAGFVTKSEY